MTNKAPKIRLKPLHSPTAREVKTAPPKVKAKKEAIDRHLGSELVNRLQSMTGYDLGSTEFLSAVQKKDSPDHALAYKITEINLHTIPRLSAIRLLHDILPELNMFPDREREIIKIILAPSINQLKDKSAMFFVYEYGLGNMHDINPENFLVKMEEMVNEYDKAMHLATLKVKGTKKGKGGKAHTVYAPKRESKTKVNVDNPTVSLAHNDTIGGASKKKEERTITPTVIVRRKKKEQ